MEMNDGFLLLEQTILGIILENNETMHNIIEIITKDDFYQQIHQEIFYYIRNRFLAGKTTDHILLYNFLQHKDIPVEYVQQLQGIFNKQNIVYYAQNLRNLSLKRQLYTLQKELLERLDENKDNIQDDISFLEEKVHNLLTQNQKNSTVNLYNAMISTLKELQNKNHTKLYSGMDALDELTGGLRPGELTILAARPSVGKTALSLFVATNLIKQKQPVLFISLEMPKEQICMRILSSQTNIPVHYFLHRNLSEKMLVECSDQINNMDTWPMFIDDNPACTLYNLKQLIRSHVRKFQIKVVFIDYLQLILGNSKETREQELAQISRSLKIFSKEFNVSIFCLSQMSRAIEKRSKNEQRTQLSDIRGSGAIEQDADVVMFLSREQSDDPKKLLLSLAKNRNGPIGECLLEFNGAINDFTERFDISNDVSFTTVKSM